MHMFNSWTQDKVITDFFSSSSSSSSFLHLSLSLSLSSFRDLTTTPHLFDSARCLTAVLKETFGITTPTCISTWPNLIRRESRMPWSAWKQGKDGGGFFSTDLLADKPDRKWLCTSQGLSAPIGGFSGELFSWEGPQLRAVFVNLTSITGFLLSCVKEKQIQDTLKCGEPVGFLKLIGKLVQLYRIFQPNRKVKKQSSTDRVGDGETFPFPS